MNCFSIVSSLYSLNPSYRVVSQAERLQEAMFVKVKTVTLMEATAEEDTRVRSNHSKAAVSVAISCDSIRKNR